MYESITYEFLLKRLLDRAVAKNPNLDTREGSVIYDAIAPAAAELSQMYIELDTILNETFADTASREMLIKRAAERGIKPYPATYAVLKAEFNIDVPLSSRFSMDSLNFFIFEKISTNIYKAQCETAGIVGNDSLGDLIPIDYIEGLQSAKLTELLIPGEDEEDTETLRSRYYDSLESSAFGGNITDYKEKVNAIPGVGGVKVYPVWNGGGTVKLVIINSDFAKPTDVLIDTVQTIIDPVQNQGEGLGFAPIGHVVTVQGVQTTIINITTTIVYQQGWKWEDVKPYAEQAIDDLLHELATTWDDNKNLIVRISQIESRLLNVTGIVDISNTKINGVAQNVELGEDNIPMRGTIN